MLPTYKIVVNKEEDPHPRSQTPAASENYLSYSQSVSTENRDDYDKEYPESREFGKALNANSTQPLVRGVQDYL